MAYGKSDPKFKNCVNSFVEVAGFGEDLYDEFHFTSDRYSRLVARPLPNVTT